MDTSNHELRDKTEAVARSLDDLFAIQEAIWRELHKSRVEAVRIQIKLAHDPSAQKILLEELVMFLKLSCQVMRENMSTIHAVHR